jgi:TPR repeat protein
LAIIQLDPTDIHPLPLADSSTVKIGQRVFVIGSPEGLTNTLSDGLVSNITRTGAVETSTPSLQITAPISHGSSGGPVLLESGQVVGVANAFLREGQNINFAVPVDSICDVLDAMNSLDGLKTLQNRADAGDVHAIYELGLMYELGCGVELDWKQARSWYRKGADMGDANSMAAVGDLTYRTYTTDGKPDGADAIVWFRKAAVAGNSFAEDKMGQIYLFGWGVPKDSSMAVVWFRRAAIHGNSQALIDLGFCYQRGKGVPVDSDESHKLFQMAADEGNTWGQEALDAEAQPMTAADWDAVMRVLKAAAATNPSPDSP